MADTFPPNEAAELNTCGDEEEEEEGIHLGEEMDEDFTVQLGATYSCRKADGTYLEAEVVKMRTNKRAKREEYMVRYAGLTRRQTEWVDKSRLVLLNPPEDEIVEEGSEQEMSENGQTLQSEKPDEDEPETKKPKVESNESVDRSSLTVPGDFAEELTCLLCSKLYDDPVMVECGHNFCRRCVDETWADQDFFTCPDCKDVQTEKSYCTNRALGRLVKKATSISEAPIPFKNCDDHEEQVRFYCKEDGTLSCVICQDSLKHTNHTFLPIPEAVEVYRAQLPGLINPLEEALTKTEELAVQYSEQIEQHQSKMTEYRQQVATEFANLYGFLKDRKASLLEQLQTQGQDVLKEMEANSAKLVVNRDNLKQVLVDAGEKVGETNAYSFLPGIKPLLKKLKEQKKAALTTRNTLSDKELCHGLFNGPLQYITWRQMKSVIGPIPESDDLTRLKKKKSDSSVGSSKDAVKKSDQKLKPESVGDQEAAAQGPEIPVEDFSDLINNVHKEIWITGDGYISATRRYVDKRPYANNLLFPKSVCNVHWLTNSKVWSGVLAKLRKADKTYKKPNVIFIHMGNFELGRRGSDLLNTSVPKILDGISGLFPGVEIILSTVLPRSDWLGTQVENHRRSFNATLRRYAGKRRFQVVKHNDLEKVLFQRLRRGGGGADAFLKDSECALFLKSIREALLKDLKGRKRPYESAKEQEWTNKMEPFRQGVQPPSPRERGVLFSKEPQTIWIIGNNYIYKAYGHVGKRPYGPHLGYKEFNWNLRWLGRTTRWDKMLPDLQKSIGTQSMPSALFIHLGSDDLELTSYEGLVEDMRTSLGQLIKMYPKVKIVLSAVLPKAEWMGSHLDDWRKMFNTRLDRYAARHGFQMVKYDLLEQRMAARFSKDGDSDLTADEHEAFVAGIKDSMLKAMLKGIPSAGKNIQKQEQKSVSSREGGKGSSSKPVRSSDETRQRTLSSTDKESDANASITESEKLEASMEVYKSTPIPGLSPGQKMIFIAGDAIISKISELEDKIPYGASLGFEEDKWNVRWIGNIMKWSNVIAALKKYSGSKTGAIYLHLGSMEIARNRTNFAGFFGEVRLIIGRVAWLFPKAQIVLSSIFPRLQWMADNREQNRKKFNEKLLDFASKQGFEFVGHKAVEEKILARFKRGDPSSLLSNEEMEEFVKDVKDALQKAVEKGDRKAVKKPQPKIVDFDESELDKPDEEYEEPPIDPDNLPERSLWIIGSPFIRAVHMEALNSSLGQNLGLEKRNWTLQWMDKIVYWADLIPKMRESSQVLGEPSAVFIHLGNNDLGQYGIKKLIGNVRSYLGRLSNTFPKTQFIFSPILPKAEWLGKSQEGCRRKFNNSVAIFARKCGLDVLSHDRLEKMRLVRFKNKNYTVALSPSEIEVFMKTIRISLLKAMFKAPNAASGSFYVPLGSREPQEVVLSSGATLYFVPDIEERRKFYKEFNEEEHMKSWKAAHKSSPDRDESDQSESDRSDSDEDSDLENSDREDEEEADQDKEKGTDGEKGSDIREEADQDKEKMDTDEGKDIVQEGEEQDAEVKGANERRTDNPEEGRQNTEEMGTDEGRSASLEGGAQDEEKMECDPPATLQTTDSAPDQPENPPGEEKSGPGQVWIIGSSFLCRAKQYAQSKPYWNNLGLDEQNVAVHWMGYIGMRWEVLAEEVEKARSELGIPNVVIIHLGGNDMGRMPYKQFFKAVKYDLRRFCTRFRKTHFIFSSILPRTEWLMTPVEQVRMKFNRVIVKCSWNLSCHVLVHNNFEDKVIARFKSGRGNDLSDMEYHLLLTSIKDSVQKVLTV